MAEETLPVDDYYPSAKVRLIIRFDEFADPKVQQKGRAQNKKAPIKKTGVSDSPALTTGDDPAAPAGTTRILLKGGGAVPGGPQKQTSSDDQYTQVLAGIIPKNANWSQNGARQADTLSLSLQWLDLPVDPRTIRSCAVEYYLGCVTAEDFARGVNGETRGTDATFFGFAGTEPLNLVPDQYVDIHGNQRTNLRFQGWVDLWTVEWTDNDTPMVKLECRDNTSILIEQDAPQKLVIGMKKPIDQAIADYLANFPQFAGFSIEYRPAGAAVPVLDGLFSKTAGKQGPTPSKAGGAASAGAANKLSVWDYFTDVCGSIGHMVRVEGTNIIIERARGYTVASYGRPDDPFKSRTVNGETFFTRRLIWGRNLQGHKVSRSYAKTTPTNVEVRCYYPERKKTLVSRYPAAAQSVQSATPGNTSSEKWVVYRTTGIKDQKTIDLIAQSVYEQIVRNEFHVSLKTRSLGSFGGENEDPDLLDMIAGDSIEVLTNRDGQGGDGSFSSQTQIETLMALQGQAQEFYSALGYDAEFATAAAKAVTNGGFLTVFRVKTVANTWDIEEGVAFDIAAINYLEVRMDQTLPQGNELPPGKKLVGPS